MEEIAIALSSLTGSESASEVEEVIMSNRETNSKRKTLLQKGYTEDEINDALSSQSGFASKSIDELDEGIRKERERILLSSSLNDLSGISQNYSKPKDNKTNWRFFKTRKHHSISNSLYYF